MFRYSKEKISLKNYMKQIYYADAKARTPLVLSSRIQHRTTSLLLRVLSEMIPLMGKARKKYLEKQSNSSNTYLFIIYLHFFLERSCFCFWSPSVVHLVCHHFSRGTDNRDQIISLHVDLNGDDGTRFYLFPYSIYNILSVNHGCSWSRTQNINLKVYFISELCVLLNLWPAILAVLIVLY